MLTEAAERIRDSLARCWQEALGRDGFRLAEAVPFYLREMEINRRVDVVRNKTILDRHLVPFFGDLRLRQITREQGYAYIEHRRKEGAADGTIKREWNVLRALLNCAVNHDCLDKNRLKAIQLPQGNKRERTLSPEEWVRLHCSLAKVRPGRDYWAAFDALRVMDVGLNIGLRLEKLLAIEGRDIVQTPEGWVLRISKARSPTKRNPEVIPLNAQALWMLGYHLDDLGAGGWPPGRVFSRWKGEGSFKHLWRRIVKRAGIEDLHFHDMRHTFSTMLQNLRVSEETRDLLFGGRRGHTAYYSHGGRSQMREAVNKLAEAWQVVALLVPRDRIELSTPAFSGLCSAN